MPRLLTTWAANPGQRALFHLVKSRRPFALGDRKQTNLSIEDLWQHHTTSCWTSLYPHGDIGRRPLPLVVAGPANERIRLPRAISAS